MSSLEWLLLPSLYNSCPPPVDCMLADFQNYQLLKHNFKDTEVRNSRQPQMEIKNLITTGRKYLKPKSKNPRAWQICNKNDPKTKIKIQNANMLHIKWQLHDQKDCKFAFYIQIHLPQGLPTLLSHLRWYDAH